MLFPVRLFYSVSVIQSLSQKINHDITRSASFFSLFSQNQHAITSFFPFKVSFTNSSQKINHDITVYDRYDSEVSIVCFCLPTATTACHSLS